MRYGPTYPKGITAFRWGKKEEPKWTVEYTGRVSKEVRTLGVVRKVTENNYVVMGLEDRKHFQTKLEAIYWLYSIKIGL